MLVLVPQTMADTTIGGERYALKIVSHIVCKQIYKVPKKVKKEHKKLQMTPPPDLVYGRFVEVGAGREFKSIASNYREVCDQLIKERWIECDNICAKGVKCFGYRLHESRWRDGLTLTAISQRQTKKIINFEDNKGVGDLSTTYRTAEDHFKSFQLDDSHCNRIEGLCSDIWWGDLRRQHVARFFSSYWWSKIDKYGRYHTPLASLPRSVRALLTCDGEPLFEGDFANFQPALLTRQLSWPIPKDEDRRFRELCSSGTLYEYMCCSYPGLGNRDRLKTDLLMMFNRKNGPMVKSRVYKAFRREFPAYADALVEIKKNTHTAAAALLQTLEAKMMYGHVVPAFRKLTNAPYFTVHDGLFAPLSAKEHVTSALSSLITTTNIPTIVKTRIHHHPVYSSHYPPINDGMKNSGVVETTPNPMA